MSVDLYSNSASKALIKSLINKGREPHSIAICGDKGQGKKAMAAYIAAALLCENAGGEPCGHCKACRMVASGVHPDFITIRSNDNGNYQVDVIRSMVADAVTKPNEGKYKVYLIPDLDRSASTAIQVQNILLKLIEEPPAHCVIILTAASKEIFLETVISRVLCLRTEPCTAEDSRSFLTKKGYTAEQADKAIAFGGGNIGRCVEYLENPIFSEAMGIAGESMNAIYADDEYGLLKALFAADGKKPLLRQVLIIMKEALRDCCVLRAGGRGITGCLHAESQRLAEKFIEIECAHLYEVVSGSLEKLDANANQALTVNALVAEVFDR